MIDSDYGDRMIIQEAESCPCASASKEIPCVDLPYNSPAPNPRRRRFRSSLTLRPARSRSRLATLYTESSDRFVTSAAASIATGWSEPVPGRELHPLKSSAFHGALLRQLKWSNCYPPTSCVALALATSSSIRFFIAGWGTLPGSKNLEAHGIANSDRVIGCCCRQTEVAM